MLPKKRRTDARRAVEVKNGRTQDREDELGDKQEGQRAKSASCKQKKYISG